MKSVSREDLFLIRVLLHNSKVRMQKFRKKEIGRSPHEVILGINPLPTLQPCREIKREGAEAIRLYGILCAF
jgi:hypothetical protein